MEDRESIQLLNTAIIKCKEKNIDCSYEERLAKICKTPVVKSLGVAIAHLSESQKISRDQAAIQIIETIHELDDIWKDYVIMEGITNLKGLLNQAEIGQDEFQL